MKRVLKGGSMMRQGPNTRPSSWPREPGEGKQRNGHMIKRDHVCTGPFATANKAKAYANTL